MSSFLSGWRRPCRRSADVVLKQHAESYTQELIERGRDSRKADVYGHLWAGWELLTSFLVDVEALTSDERDRLIERVDGARDAALTELATSSPATSSPLPASPPLREVMLDRLAIEQVSKAAAGQLSGARQMDTAGPRCARCTRPGCC